MVLTFYRQHTHNALTDKLHRSDMFPTDTIQTEMTSNIINEGKTCIMRCRILLLGFPIIQSHHGALLPSSGVMRNFQIWTSQQRYPHCFLQTKCNERHLNDKK